jgi:hypothetical protein
VIARGCCPNGYKRDFVKNYQNIRNEGVDNKAALIERADHALCDFMDNPKKIASAATPIVT